MPDSPAYERLQQAAAQAAEGARLLALRTLKDVHWECAALEEEWRDRQGEGAEHVRTALARIRAKLAPATTNPYGNTGAENHPRMSPHGPGVVAYRSADGRIIRCLEHAPDAVSEGRIGVRGVGGTSLFVELSPVTAEEIADGESCTQMWCGIDILAQSEVRGE
jgi:hypothetical protein